METSRELTRQRARALCYRLGKHWKPRVWENLGWHYAAGVEGPVRVEVHASHYGDITSYTAFLHNLWTGTAPTPEGAIKKAMSKAEADVRAAISAWAQACGQLGEPDRVAATVRKMLKEAPDGTPAK